MSLSVTLCQLSIMFSGSTILNFNYLSQWNIELKKLNIHYRKFFP